MRDTAAPSPRSIPKAHSPALIWTALGSVYIIWGSTYLAIRVAIRTLPPLLMASVRFLIAGALLYAWSIRRGDRSGDRPGLQQWTAATIVGGTLILGGNGLVVVAEQHVSSSITALLIATVPLWMALIGRIVYRERLSFAVVLGLAVGFAGLVFLVGERSGANRIDPLGAGLLVGAALSWAAGSLYSRRAPLPKRPLVGTGMEMLAGGVLQGIVGLARGELGAFDPGSVTLESVLAVLYLIVFGALVAFTAYVWLLRVTRTTIVSTYAYVNPVVAVFLGWAILSEPVSGRTLIAGAIIVAGIALIVRSRAGERETAEPFASPADMPPPPEEPEAVSKV